MQVRVIQHPVGQGGLLSGELTVGDATLRWLYDCGSNQAYDLTREISQVVDGRDIDLLFLSHLDSDHVSGVDQLLRQANVGHVILPYLNELDLKLTVCRDLELGVLNSSFLAFAEAPEEWFLGRGVGAVTFVRPVGDGDPSSSGTPELPPLSDKPRDFDGFKVESLEPMWIVQGRKPTKQRIGLVNRMNNSAVVGCFVNAQLQNWVLSPYAHRPSVVGVRKFQNELRAVFGRAASLAQIIAASRTSIGRSRLKRCYGAIWSDHNLVSMSLYSGPFRASSSPTARLSRRKRWKIKLVENAFGWLSTGDANLSGIRRRTAFLQHYESFLEYTGVLVAPHHGAASSFHPDFPKKFPNLALGIAAAGKNSYGHPHKVVSHAFKLSCGSFWKVSSALASGVILDHRE